MQHKGINHKRMSHSNKLIVFNLIRLKGPITRTELAQISGLSKAAISSSVKKLLNRNIITESKHEGYKEVGRKPLLLSVNPQAVYFISVDIGFTETQFSVTDLNNHQVSKIQRETPRTWKQILNLLTQDIQKVSNWSNVSRKKVKGASIGIPGVVDSDGTVSYLPKIGDSQDYPLQEKLSSKIEMPILLENNVNLATLGELSMQYGDHSNLVYISFHRDGLGAGIAINGSLYEGAEGHAGEIGWFVTNRNSLDGKQKDNQGFLESQVTATALTDKCINLLKKRDSDDPLLDKVDDPGQLDVETIFRGYRTSSVANQVIEEWVKDVATSLVAISSLLDPDLIILGGEIVESAKPAFQELTDLIDKQTQRTPKIEVSDNYTDNVLHGGAQLCFENLDKLIWEERVSHGEDINF
ncbi:MAG: ROK family transcriptional regulator [Candidatus Bipolaricaulota bacterium]|nr:ROK family transcriptional regulator [Candidatus Bipolaricaulota bacterium]MBS3791579.1 ROK family transcriptional regulator [Candidatus Bipolaricaulota bacterium]